MNKITDEWVHVGGEGVWKEYKNVKTGETTLKTLANLKTTPNSTSYDTCTHEDSDHGFWELTNPTGNTIQCQKCGLGRTIVWGIDILENGRIVHKKSS